MLIINTLDAVCRVRASVDLSANDISAGPKRRYSAVAVAAMSAEEAVADMRAAKLKAGATAYI